MLYSATEKESLTCPTEVTSPVLVRGRWLIPGGDSLADAVADGAVVVGDGVVREVGPWVELRERHPDAETLGSAQHAVLPGLINAHHHSSGLSGVQQGISDLPLESWLLTLARRRRVDPYLATILTSARLLRAGVTSVVDVYSAHGTPDDVATAARQAISAYDEAGVRVAFAMGMTEQSHLVWGDDERFLTELPRDLRRLAQRLVPQETDLGGEDYFSIFDELRSEIQNRSRISLWFAPPGPQWCSDATWVRIAEAAERYDTRIQTHLLESIFEKQFGARAYGRPTVLHLQELGVLGPRISFAHGVWLTEPEIEALAASGASVSHNPSSNLRLRAGIAPLMAMLSRGLNVGLGLDANALNDDDDMLTEMRMALRLHRSPRPDDVAPTPADVFGMATWRGARLLGDTRLGRIAPGYAADLVLLRLDNVTWPWIAPESDPLELLVCRASSRDVDTVLVDGEVVLRDGSTTRFDAAAAGRELHAALSATAFPEDEAALVARLLPAVEAYYRSWELDEHDPFITYNSRC